MTKRMSFSLLIAIFLLLPFGVDAVSITDLVQKNAKTVSRSDFLSWTYSALKIPYGRQDCDLPYKRSPRGMKLILCNAQEKGVLDIFGRSEAYVLRDPITRGEALRVLTLVTFYEEREDTSQYRDVVDGADAEAVMNALALNWMVPSSSTVFGIDQKLTGTEALSVLQAVTGDTSRSTTITVSLPDRTATMDIPGADLLDAIWEVVRRDYLHSDSINEQEVTFRAIEAMLDALDDPYSTFLRPVRASDFQSQIQGEFTGIGAHVVEKEDVVTIVAPLPGSPAEKAGLKAGDQILKAGTIDLSGMTLEQAISHIRGERGTTVSLTIRRNGNELIVPVTRDVISIPEIEEFQDGEIRRLRLVQFGQTTDTEIRSVMQNISQKNPQGFILDLRNNGGGLLSAAETVMSVFVPRGTTYARVKSKLREREEETFNDIILPADIPMVVLVNEASASASEIVAGALQDLGRATVIGTKTFGKGTVQEVVGFTGGSAIKLTIAEWLTPLGRSIEGAGVTPDIIVEGDDEQLSRAIQHIYSQR